MPRQSTVVPPELLYEIVGLILAEYLDDVIAGFHRLPGPTPMDLLTTGLLTDTELQELQKPLVSPPIDQNTEDPALSFPSPIVPLLRVSFQLREVTLKVMSDALGIAIDNKGVGR